MNNLAPACSECGDTGRSHRVELESGWRCISCIQKMESRVRELEAENKFLKRKENGYIQQCAILEAIVDLVSGNEVSEFMESFPIVRAIKDIMDQIVKSLYKG